MKKMLASLLVVLMFAAPIHAQDMIDLSRAQILNAPDVRTWAPTARLTGISFTNGVTRVAFTKQNGPDSWPDTMSPGWAGPLQYTLWLFVRNGDQWVGSGFIQFWRGRDGSGTPADPDVPSVYDKHWYYAPRWSPIFGHGPILPGEQIGFMVSAGNARDSVGPFPVPERSNVVVFAATDTGAYSFDASPVPAPQPLPAPVPVPAPVPAPAPLPTVDLGPLTLQLQQCVLAITSVDSNVSAGRAENQEFYARVHSVWQSIGVPIFKFIVPAVTAYFAGKTL